jgi:hypothetical protein
VESFDARRLHVFRLPDPAPSRNCRD